LGKALSRLHPEHRVMMVVVHPRRARTVLGEALARPHPEHLVMMVVMHPRRTLPKLRSILRKASARWHAKPMMVMVHSRSLLTKLPAILRKASARWHAEPMMVMVHSWSALTKLRAVLCKASARWHTESMMVVVHLRSLGTTLRFILCKARPTHRRPLALHSLRSRLTRPGPVLRETLLHLLHPALPHFAGKLAALIPLRLRPTITPSGLGTTIGPRSRILRLGTAWTTGIRTLRPAGLETRTATPIATLLVRSRISAPHPSSVAIAVATRLARLPIISARTAHEITATLPTEELFPSDPAISLTIELLEHLGCVLQFLGIDYSIVVRIEQVED
jgi:hypothetical protein